MKLNRSFAIPFAAGILVYAVWAAAQSPADATAKTISATDCTANRIGTTSPAGAIGEPVQLGRVQRERRFTMTSLPDASRVGTGRPGSGAGIPTAAIGLVEMVGHR